jgi:Flp pilus assembly protein TadG
MMSWKRRLRRDDGSATVFVVIIVPVLLLCGGLVLDGGSALAGRARAMGEADEAARAGADAIDVTTYRTTGRIVLDAQRADAAATGYLSASGDEFRLMVHSDSVTVTVTHREKTQLLNLGGIDSLATTSTATAHPVTSEAPAR